MEVEIIQDCAGVDWKAESETLKRLSMADYKPCEHKKAIQFTTQYAHVVHTRTASNGIPVINPKQLKNIIKPESC